MSRNKQKDYKLESLIILMFNENMYESERLEEKKIGKAVSTIEITWEKQKIMLKRLKALSFRGLLRTSSGAMESNGINFIVVHRSYKLLSTYSSKRDCSSRSGLGKGRGNCTRM